MNQHFISGVTSPLICGPCVDGRQQMGPADVLVVYGGSVSRVLRRECVDEAPEQSSYQQGEFQQQGKHWTPGIPAVTGFIYVGKGVEMRGSGLSFTHVRWGSGQQ